jgi:putative FmdB family regulatory protein
MQTSAAAVCAMPTYEYHCTKCDQNFEAFQSMRDDSFRECPKELCRLEKWGHGKVKRLVGTGAGLIFKGSGFYSTDYRSSSYMEAAKKEAPVKSSPETPDTAKTSPAKTAAATSTDTSERKSKKAITHDE